jgi:hypothetical protein
MTINVFLLGYVSINPTNDALTISLTDLERESNNHTNQYISTIMTIFGLKVVLTDVVITPR